MTTLVIGIGNDLRGDDAAGPWVAKLIGGKKLAGVEAMLVHQLTPELSEAISKAARVIFVDATALPQQQIEMRQVAPGKEGEPRSHFGSPEYLLSLAQKLFGAAPEAWLMTLPAASFDFAETLTPTALAAVEQAVQKIESLVKNS